MAMACSMSRRPISTAAGRCTTSSTTATAPISSGRKKLAWPRSSAGLNLVQTDYNNDGCKDILLLRGGWEVAQRDSLLRNNCDGTFSDVTIEKSGLDTLPAASQTGAWADINNDGRLIFVGNEDRPSQLYLNTGTRFEDISRAAGVDRMSFAKGITAGDYDNDGFDDFYISNYDGRSVLYRNNGNNTFTDDDGRPASPARGADSPPGSSTTTTTYWLGYLCDLLLARPRKKRADVSGPAAQREHAQAVSRTCPTAHSATSRRTSGLTRCSCRWGRTSAMPTMTAFWTFIGMGTPSFGSMAPHVLLRPVPAAASWTSRRRLRTGELHKDAAVPSRISITTATKTSWPKSAEPLPGDSHAMRVFENPGQGNDWLTLRLVGTKSNRAAIGARISRKSTTAEQPVRCIAPSTAAARSGPRPLEQHIGLGKNARIRSVNIWWPASNTRQRFTDVAANQVIEITESSSTFKTIDRTRARLGGARRTP